MSVVNKWTNRQSGWDSRDTLFKVHVLFIKLIDKKNPRYFKTVHFSWFVNVYWLISYKSSQQELKKIFLVEVYLIDDCFYW